MRITLVIAEVRSDFPGFTGYYSEGVATLASILKERGDTVTLVHVTRPESEGAIADRILASAPDAVGFSCMSHTFRYVQRYARELRRRRPGIPAIIGGVHATLHPEECIRTEGIDVVCTGEGEFVLPEFIQRIETGSPWHDIPGTWSMQDGCITRNRPATAVMDLDALPLPDRSLFPAARLMSAGEGVLYAYASRGCPFDCSFCCNDALQQALPSGVPPVRLKSVERVCREIETSEEFRGRSLIGIYFQDDIFPVSSAWLESFAQVYPQRIGIPFNCNLRADVVTPERIRLLKAAGCVSVSIGVESGIASIRAAVLGKQISDERFMTAFDLLHRSGIRINTFSMVGLPEETCASALETVRFNSHPAVNNALCSIFFPYVGTVLYDRCSERGLLTDIMSDTYQYRTVLRQTSIRPSQVEFIHDFFGVMIAVIRRYGEGSRAVKRMFAWVMQGDLTLSLVTRSYRFIRRILIVPYLSLGKYILNRQRRVFGTG